MGNTLNNLTNTNKNADLSKTPIRSSESEKIQQIDIVSGEEWIKCVPKEILLDIFEYVELHPATVLRCQLLSKYWRDIFKSNDIWKLMCKQYSVPSIYFKDGADYFALFLSRYALCFVSEKSIEYYKTQYEDHRDHLPLKPVKVSNNPGAPAVIIGRFSLNNFLEENPIPTGLANYDRYFKNLRVHPNLALQKIFTVQDNWDLLSYFETTENYLTSLLITRPELVTEANVCDVIKQILSAVEWLNDRQIYTHHLNLENIRANVLPDNKFEIKIYSSLFDFSGKKAGNHGIPDQVPPEVLRGEACTEKSYAWMVGWITYKLLTGRNPFARQTFHAELDAITNADYAFNEPNDNHVTPSARDFISKLLLADQSARMTVKQALNHEWIRSPNKSTKPMSSVIEGYKIKYKS